MWLDERRIQPGDEWEQEVLPAIRRTIRLFVPVISANTERERKATFPASGRKRQIDRARIPGRRFIVPVVIDDDYDGDPSRYRQIPDEFRRLPLWSRAGRKVRTTTCSRC